MTPTGTRSPVEPVRPAPRSPWPMLIGYQAPLLLWTGYALLKPWIGTGGAWCPTHHLLGWCPACGMTGAYSALLYTGRIPDLWTCCILLGFAATSCWAVVRFLKPCP